MKRLFILILALFITGFSIYGVSRTNAQSTANTQQTLIQKIAEKFNLNKDEVQDVADDFRTQKIQTMQAERKARLEQKLSEAVSSGKISETQKQAILKKHDELQKKHEAERAEMETWAQQNGLDNLGFGFKGFGMHKFGFGMQGGMHGW
ncbi:MAG TPA: hypothetical protein VJI69_07550 [Bacteroidia bacterium]|nr:hypothetical protein [Bacteroidia bacterium]